MNAAEIEIGKQYLWKHDGLTERVIVTGPPRGDFAYSSGGDEFPSSVIQCEVKVLPNEKLAFAPVEQLFPIDG